MEPAAILYNLIFDYTLRTVALGAAVLGITSGALGSFALLRKQSLLGDAISHAALPGIVLAYLLTGSKQPLSLMLGAMIAGWLATVLLLRIVSSTRIKYDSALAFVLSVFFGLGLMLLTFVQRLPGANKAGLDKFLFGQAATLVETDIITMALLGGLALVGMIVLWKEFKLLSFDPQYAASLGMPVRLLDFIMTTLLVTSIVIGLQAVGVVLMSAMLVAPAAAARQWTDRLGIMVILAALCGALGGISGAVISSTVRHLSTGPTIVLFMSIIVLISMLFAPRRGLVWQWLQQQRQRKQVQADSALLDLYTLAKQHHDTQHAHSTRVLRTMSAAPQSVEHSLRALENRGLVHQVHPGEWSLTSSGIAQAQHLEPHGELTDDQRPN